LNKYKDIKLIDMRLTEIDKRVLVYAELQADISIPQLAKKTGLKPHVVYYSLAKLEREGVIRRTPFINMPKLGYTDYSLFFSLAAHNTKLRADLIEYLQRSPLVTWFVEVGGDYQYGIALYVQNPTELMDFITNLSIKFGGLFFHKSFSLHTRFARFNRTYLSPDVLRQTVGGSSTTEVTQIDSVDQRILSALSTHTNSSLQELARILKIPFSTLHYRLEALKKQDILSQHIYFVNTNTLNVQAFEILIHTKGLDAAMADRLFLFSQKHRNITHFIQSIGSWDFRLGIEVETMQEATEVVQSIYAEFGDSITTITTLPLFRHLKFTFYRNNTTKETQ
jgi:DNA-binding Lrp family transcriptional regulator